ncbi:MAG: hypothetical protein GXO75_15975 [Calditrichaeota bacterium]|nr:hypothetical protein [Calditrichota bacterium]
MTIEIGAFAGVVWEALSKKSPMTVAKIKKETQGSDFMVAAAIGWLAREEMLEIAKSARSIKVALR